jgi:hypothetical protein
VTATLEGNNMTDTPKTTLINIRGWLEGSQDDLELVKQFVEDDLPHNWSNFGWRFPHQQRTGHWYAFYGLHVDVDDRNWFISQLRRMATLTTSGTKPLIRGLFIISHEDETMTEARITDGEVHLTPCDLNLAYLDS